LAGILVLPLRKSLSLNGQQMKKKQVSIASLLLCFGAGVLLATSFLHILPEAREGMLEVQESLGIECLAELALCSGIFLVYFVENLVHLVLDRTMKSNNAPTPALSTCPHPNHCANREDSIVTSDQKQQSYGSMDESASSSGSSSDIFYSHASSSLISMIVTAFALSSHCLLEGLAVGVEESTTGVWALCIAILVHKCVIAFSMSLELIQSLVRLPSFFLYLTAFCIMTPLGIGIGIGVLEMPNSEYHGFTVSLLQAISGGSIVYCVMFEIIQREKQKEVSGMLQLLGILLGFVGMLLLDIYFREPEEEEGEKGSHLFPHLNRSQFMNGGTASLIGRFS